MPPLPDPRQEAFCREYLAKANEPDKTDADCFRAAGYTAKNNRTAIVGASRLLTYADIKGRIAELQAPVAAAVQQAVIEELKVTTVDVARKLWLMANFDISTIMRVESVTTTVGRGRRARQEAVQRFVIRDTSEWPEEIRRLIQGFRTQPDGTIIAILPDRRQAAIKVGEHLGMFQGETGSLGGSGRTPNAPGAAMNVYKHGAREETFEEWVARVERERGIKQLPRQSNAARSSAAEPVGAIGLDPDATPGT